MASVDCYLCVATASSGAGINNFSCVPGDPLGSCHFCSVFACGYHAIRNTNPKGWECVVCVPSHMFPPPKPGGGPVGGPGGSPPSGSQISHAYTAEEFQRSFPTASTLLLNAVRNAIDDPAAIFERYFGADYATRISQEFGSPVFSARSGQILPDTGTGLAAALAVIELCEIPDDLLLPYLRRNPEGEILNGLTV